MKKTIWMMNGKGGVGKTTLGVMLYSMYRVAGWPLAVMDVDGQAKIAGFLPGVTSLGIGARQAAIAARPSLVVSFWDALPEFVVGSAGSTLVDFGANIDRAIFEYAEKSGIAEEFAQVGISMELWVPVMTEPKAMSGGIEALTEAGRVFPEARRILVLNEYKSDFDDYKEGNPEFDLIHALYERGEIEIVRLPKCVSEGWVAFEKGWVTPAEVVDMTPEAICQRFQLDSIRVARRARGDVAAWISEVYREFGTLVPPPAV